MSEWQRYVDPISLEWLAAGLCPECGASTDEHGGWGGPRGCPLTDIGVAGRIYQFGKDQAAEQASGTDRLALGNKRALEAATVAVEGLDRSDLVPVRATLAQIWADIFEDAKTAAGDAEDASVEAYYGFEAMLMALLTMLVSAETAAGNDTLEQKLEFLQRAALLTQDWGKSG